MDVDQTGHDPCDQMVSLCQVASYLASPGVRGGPVRWDLAGIILDCSRDEAKRRVYHYCYGGHQ